eukprot:5584676-Prymnesium_polylepis.1
MGAGHRAVRAAALCVQQGLPVLVDFQTAPPRGRQVGRHRRARLEQLEDRDARAEEGLGPCGGGDGAR